jgi:ATP-dependent Zn protease
VQCTLAGTDFYDVYTGVGARRIRETFEMLRNFAPAVLFVDEFDALGAARGAAAAGDESASIINELLVQVGCKGMSSFACIVHTESSFQACGSLCKVWW